MYFLCYALAAIGVGTVVSVSFSWLIDVVKTLFNSFLIKAKGRRRQRESKLNLIEKLKKSKKQLSDSNDLKNLALAGLIGGLFTALAMPGLLLKLGGFLLGVCVGLFIYIQYDNMKKGGDKARQLREAVLLYDAVDVFTSHGYSVQQALEKSLTVLKTLRPAVEKCLRRYPYEPLKSISGMVDDLQFNEAGTFISVLLQLHVDGARDQNLGSRIASSEAVRLEKIRRTLMRTNIALRPSYQQFRLYLPLASGVALILYCLIRHVQVQFSSMTGANMLNQMVK